jgi:hypothetical protein
MPQPHPEATVEVQKPRLLHGETTQGFMTIRYLPTRKVAEVWKRKSIPLMQLSDKLWVLLSVLIFWI